MLDTRATYHVCLIRAEPSLENVYFVKSMKLYMC